MTGPRGPASPGGGAGGAQLALTARPLWVSPPENLLQNSLDESWAEANPNRVSVIQFLEDPQREEEEEEEEAGAEKRVMAEGEEQGWTTRAGVRSVLGLHWPGPGGGGAGGPPAAS